VRTVTAAEVTKRLVELLGLKSGDSFELAKLKNGSVMVSKTDQAKIKP
jgi:hypothetical protein